jgi:phosphatidylserine/phosphatidylglycerophosphate/cardiolipin synthase-like enzyme
MTAIKIVSNSEKTHLDELRVFFQSNASRLIIASPFLATNITHLLNEFSFSNIDEIELITTFKPKDIEQLSKPAILKDYFGYFKEKYPNIKTRLHVDNQLHGKLYISLNHGRRSLIISSANFTRNGLCNNHEWGLLVNDNDLIDTVVEDLINSIEYPDVTYNQIKKACEHADIYKRDHPEWTKKPEVVSDILEQVYSVNDSSNTEPQYFLKPVGVTENPVLLEDKEDFSELNQYLHFSKKKPKGVRKGDILITVAVTAGSLLSYFKVTGVPQEVTEEEKRKDKWKERWPWYVEARNQSPEFGKSWWSYNIQRKNALQEFLSTNPGKAVTYAGGFSLGSLNYGSDKIRITKEFGEFLISKIKSK